MHMNKNSCIYGNKNIFIRLTTAVDLFGMNAWIWSKFVVDNLILSQATYNLITLFIFRDF